MAKGFLKRVFFWPGKINSAIKRYMPVFREVDSLEYSGNKI